MLQSLQSSKAGNRDVSTSIYSPHLTDAFFEDGESEIHRVSLVSFFQVQQFVSPVAGRKTFFTLIANAVLILESCRV